MQHPVTVSTFYKFVPLADPRGLREPIRRQMVEAGVKGTITLAPEGINATISGETAALTSLIDHLQGTPEIGSFTHKVSTTDAQPFARSKVKVKRELISLGVPVDVAACVGEYVPPLQWNALIARPDVITIDTRNDYEYRIGRFRGAINPNTRDFKEMVAFTQTHLNPATHPQVAMYCTGGIRCEKYSSYLLSQGFSQVYHLQGGILHYLAEVPENQSLWDGVCYVFDERVAVNHSLQAAPHITMCAPCGTPLEPHDRADARYAEGAGCPYCAA